MTTIRIASGDCGDDCSVTPARCRRSSRSRSSRLMPGLRAMPAVMTTMSEPGRLVVAVRAGDAACRSPSTGADSHEVERLALRQPLDDVDQDDVGEFGSAMRCAVVAPTFPAPTTVILLRRHGPGLLRISLRRVAEIGRAAGGPSRGRPRARPLTPSAYAAKFSCEHPGERAPPVGRTPRRRPSRARLEDLARDVRHVVGTSTPKTGSVTVGTSSSGARERGPDHLAGVVDVHPLADAVRPAGPARVHEPDRHVVVARAGPPASRRTRPGGAA